MLAAPHVQRLRSTHDCPSAFTWVNIPHSKPHCFEYIVAGARHAQKQAQTHTQTHKHMTETRSPVSRTGAAARCPDGTGSRLAAARSARRPQWRPQSHALSTLQHECAKLTGSSDIPPSLRRQQAACDCHRRCGAPRMNARLPGVSSPTCRCYSRVHNLHQNDVPQTATFTTTSTSPSPAHSLILFGSRNAISSNPHVTATGTWCSGWG